MINEIVGRFANASNTTLLATTSAGERVVYKPTAGERPLWDFPSETLAAREVLTYRVAAAMGYSVVPETVFGDGPVGPGSIQRFVEVDPEFDPLPLIQSGAASLWPIAVLDVVANNADRKLGHLIAAEGHVWGIDHGLTFHTEDKLRTVLWGFAGSPMPAAERRGLALLQAALHGELGDAVGEMLGAAALAALDRRVADLVAFPVHPAVPRDRPPLPWPPY